MRIRTLLLVAALASGCDKAKNSSPGNAASDQSGASANATAPTDRGGGLRSPERQVAPLAPEPVPKEPVAPPPSPDDVRPPVAADLAEYTKDLPGDGPLTATIDTTLGTIHCTLYGDKVPMTVANFVGLATGKKPWQDPNTGKTITGKPFFDGIIFHRVIPDFMAQTGDPLGEGVGGPGYNFDNEPKPELLYDKPGVMGMANTGRPTSNGSQFFITEVPKPDLNGGYTVFGQCDDAGVAVVKKITHVQTDPNDKPLTAVSINKVTIGRAKKK